MKSFTTDCYASSVGALAHSRHSRVGALAFYYAALLPSVGRRLGLDRCARAVACAVALWGAGVAWPGSFEARAQTARALASIAVSEEMRVEAGSEVPLSIDVKTGGAPPSQLMVLIWGLPTAIALSHGRLFDSGTWALRIGDLPALKIATPSGYFGNSKLSLSLVGMDGTVLTQTQSRLVIERPRIAGTPAESVSIRPAAGPALPETTSAAPPVALSPPPLPGSPPARITAKDGEEARQFMARGDENLKTGKVVVARKFYERAVDKGWAAGALALGRTYDPRELAQIGVIGGIKPDLGQAKAWYERARDMGLPEAAEKLQRIGKR